MSSPADDETVQLPIVVQVLVLVSTTYPVQLSVPVLMISSWYQRPLTYG
ncbi:hypothetical protein [Streptomyces sp. NPDC057460]